MGETMQIWRLDIYKSLIGNDLSAKAVEGEQAFTLKVSDVIQTNCLGEGWESFSVVFELPELIEQGTYNIEHDDYGSVEVFISPNSESEAESVFNYQIAA